MPNVNITVNLEIEGDYTESPTGQPVSQDVHMPLGLTQAIQFLTGSGVDQADTLVTQEVYLGPSGTETLDLFTGLSDALNNPVVFARVKMIALLCNVAGPVNAGAIKLAGGSSNPFLGPLAGTTPTIATNPGGATVLIAPDATAWVVNSTACNITLTNLSAAGPVAATLVILGAAE